MGTTRRAGTRNAILALVALFALALPLGVALSPSDVVDAALEWPICLGAPTGSVHHDRDHAHTPFTAGEPGNSAQPARAVPIAMIERDGRMLYLPDRIEARRNEQIRFVLTNAGEFDHEFVLATTAENDRHAQEMRNAPDMVHDGPNAKTVSAGRTAEMLWRFTAAGEYEFACLIPGHREAGMAGTVVVR